MDLVWGTLFSLAWSSWRKRSRDAIVLGLLVVSHWALDWLTHRPDMPLYPGSARLGPGLWNSIPATLTVELALFAGCVALYLSRSRSRGRAGSAGTWILIALLVGLYFAAAFGPPPPSVAALVGSSIAGWLFVPVLNWVDRQRAVIA